MRATSFFFTPSTDDVNSSTSSDDSLSEEAEVPATWTAVLTKGGGESKDGNTVVADAGMKESQSEEDDSSDLESFKNPDSLKLPEGVEEVLTVERKRRKTTTSKTLLQRPIATRTGITADVTSANTRTTLDETHSVPTQLRHTRTVPYPGKKLGNFSHGTSQMESGNLISNLHITSSEGWRFVLGISEELWKEIIQ